MRSRSLAIIVLAAVATTSAGAQAPAPAAKRHVVSIQPIPALLGIFAGEYEGALSSTVTLGVGAHVWNTSEHDYTSVEAKLRYYRQGHALVGLSVGGSVGVARTTDEDRIDEATEAKATTGLSVGMLANYGWLLGSERSWYAGVGGGIKAMLGEPEQLSGFDLPVYPTFRLAVGYAF